MAVLNVVSVMMQSIYETNNGEISSSKMSGTRSYSDLKTRKHNFYKLLIMRYGGFGVLKISIYFFLKVTGFDECVNK